MFSAGASIVWAVSVLVVCTGWACSGTYGVCHPPLWFLTAGLALLTVRALVQAEASVRRRFLRDPVFISGALLSLLLLVQWRNAGGELFADIFTGRYDYTPPPLKGWPFSLEARLSRQQLLWFVPPTLFLPAVRHLISRSDGKRLLRILLINGTLLALFGLIQFALGWDRLFNVIEVAGNPHLLASFDYPNHAGAFFYLLFAVAIGFFWDAVEKKRSYRSRILSGLMILLFGAAAFLSFSRAAVAAVAFIALAAPAAVLWQRRRRLDASHWADTLLLAGVVTVVLALGAVKIGGGAVVREFQQTGVIENDLLDYHNYRGFQIPPALAMFRDHPWFGVGGWGYRKFVALYLPPEEWGRLLLRGKANVHCDPVQFLAEHGIVGFGLMSTALAALLWPWRRLGRWRFRGLALMTGFGASAVLLHSLIDLPFRNPTVLWHWLLLAALIPLLAERGRRPDPAAGPGGAQAPNEAD